METVRAFFSSKLHKFGLVVSAALLVTAFVLPHGASAANVAFSGPFDSNANAVMYGGAADCTQLQQKYAADGSIAAIYGYFYMNAAFVNNLCNTAVAGQVTKDGQVIVGGKTVATNALTVGRLDMPGSTKVTKDGVTFYVRPPSVSFVSNNLNAFVVMNNGKFLVAMLSSCGNPVAATPVTPAPASKPTPAPTPTPATPTTTTNINNNVNTAIATTNVQVLQEQQQTQTVQSTPTPVTSAASVTALPATGAGSVIGLFGLALGAGTIGHSLFMRRRANRTE